MAIVIGIYNVQCTLYTVQCTVYSVRRTRYAICALYSVSEVRVPMGRIRHLLAGETGTKVYDKGARCVRVSSAYNGVRLLTYPYTEVCLCGVA